MSENVTELPMALPRLCQSEMERLGLSQAQAAKRIGVSSAVVNQWLRGQYKGNVAAVDAKVQAWLATEEDAEANSIAAAPVGRHVELDVTGELFATLGYAHATGDVVTVTGASGMGKTWAARHYCGLRSAAHYVAMRRTVRSLAGLLGVVGRVVCGPRIHRSALEAEEEILAALRGRRALLVIDEAQFLSPALLDELRCIRDISECGLALVGDVRLDMRLGHCPQIIGRTGASVTRELPDRRDVAALLADFLGRPAKRRETDLVFGAACGAGGLHALRRVLVRAWRLAQVRGSRTVDESDLEAAALMTAAAGRPEDAARREAVA